MEKSYIGDGVYAQVYQGMLALTTENGIDVTNTVYLEPEVLTNAVRYAEAAGLLARWQGDARMVIATLVHQCGGKVKLSQKDVDALGSITLTTNHEPDGSVTLTATASGDTKGKTK